MGNRSLQHWSQRDWIIFLGSQGPSIREIVQCLGPLHINDRGEPKFSERELQRLSSEVQRLSQTLPADPDALRRSAADPKTLDGELNALLRSHGPAIWGEAADRKRLLTAAGTTKSSPLKELFFEVPADRIILKAHLHRWILKKAHTLLQPRKATRQSAARDVTTSSGGDAAQSGESRLAPPSVRPSQGEADTIASVAPSAHTFNGRDATTKRKVDLDNPVLDDCNATKRVRQDTVRSVDQRLQELVSTLRRASESVSDAPLGDACPSPPAARSAAATSARPPVSSDIPSRHVQVTTPGPASPLASTFVAINRVTADHLITTGSYRPTSTHTASALSEASSLPVAPSMSSTGGQMRASSSSSSQRQERPGTTKNAQRPDDMLPPVGQATAHRPGHLSQDNAATVLPSPPADVSEMCHTTVHNTGQGHDANRLQAPVPREASFEQCDLLWLLLRYLFPRVGQKIEVPLLLRSLEHVWARHEQDFKLAMDQQFKRHRKVLFIWIDERRKTSQLQAMAESQTSAHTLDMVDRVLGMNDLRILRLKWKMLKVHDGSQTSSPEDSLCSTFATMTSTEGTETMFREGLDRLKEASSEAGRPGSSVTSICS